MARAGDGLLTVVDMQALHEGLEIAERAYGAAVRRYLRLSLDDFKGNRTRANACIHLSPGMRASNSSAFPAHLA